MKQSSNKSFAKAIDKEDSYNFKHYVFTSQEIHEVHLFEDDNGELNFVPREAIPLKSRSLGGHRGSLPAPIQAGIRRGACNLQPLG